MGEKYSKELVEKYLKELKKLKEIKESSKPSKFTILYSDKNVKYINK